MIKYAKEIVKRKAVKEISPTLFEVDEYSVKLQKKTGRNLYICSCYNSTRFCTESPLCVHKIAVIVYLTNREQDLLFEKIISDYKRFKGLKLTPEMVICDLEELRRLK